MTGEEFYEREYAPVFGRWVEAYHFDGDAAVRDAFDIAVWKEMGVRLAVDGSEYPWLDGMSGDRFLDMLSAAAEDIGDIAMLMCPDDEGGEMYCEVMRHIGREAASEEVL